MPLDRELAYGSGENIFMEEEALAQLLSEGILFPNYRSYSHLYRKDMEKLERKEMPYDGQSVILWVNVSDIFVWGYAEGEDLETDVELEQLYGYCVKYGKWGAAVWACLKRNEKPQGPVERLMKKDGAWPDVLDSLPENHYDARCKELYSKKT